MLERFRGVDFGYVPIGSMGLVYLPTWMVGFMLNVGKYAIHGSYGVDSGFISIEFFSYFFYIMTSQLCTTTLGKSCLLYFHRSRHFKPQI